ncbi:MAG: hypothetical protein KGJ02_05845 [Verrucomicrobiota bacterium]|nr:hypothetical protein [Verrucomicrobiota bacterium]
MARDVRSIFLIGKYQWMASLIAILLCFFPQKGHSLSSDTSHLAKSLLDRLETYDTRFNQAPFDELQQFFSNSEDPLLTAQDFFKAFLQEINTRYRLSLTLSEACQKIRENYSLLSLSQEGQETFLAVLEVLESENFPDTQQLTAESPRFRFLGPWAAKWLSSNWFNPKKSNQCQKRKFLESSKKLRENEVAVEIPGSCIVGAIEAGAGVLVLFIPIPGSQLVGWGLMGDGGRRILDGVIQLSEERRKDPNFSPPKYPGREGF